MSSALLGVVLAALVGEDCNRNGREDALDVLPGEIRFSDPLPPTLVLPTPQKDVVIADMDGDAVLDMVFTDEDGVTPAAFDGAGEFVAGKLLPVGSVPRAIIAADVDGDGDADIVTANGLAEPPVPPGNISVFRNDGGTLDLPRNYTGGRFPHSLVAGDLDGDADVDIITVGNRQGGIPDGIAVIRNDGTGRFEFDDRYPAGDQRPAGEPALADIDGDGALDLTIATEFSAPPIQLFFGDGGGRLDRTLGLELNLGGLAVEEVVPVDAGKDGDIDLVISALVVGKGGGAVSILRNDGGGVFAPAARLFDVPRPKDSVLADVDGDGWVDLALTHPFTPGTTVLRGEEGDFGPPRTYVLPGIAISIEAADWDRDGRQDLLALNLIAGSAFVIDGDSLPGAASSTTRLELHEPFGPLFLDMDGDGDQDLALTTQQPHLLRVFRNEGGALEALEPMLSGWMHSMVQADLDGDGRMDIAGTSQRGLELFFGTGGAFEPVVFPAAFALGLPFIDDMDGDGDLDVFASNWSFDGAFALVRNGGGRSFDPPVYLVSRTEGYFDILLRAVPGDFDADGDTDVLVRRGAPPEVELGLLVNPGNGAVTYRKVSDLDAVPHVVAAGDFDSDGRTDAIVGVTACDECPVRTPPTVLVFLGSGGELHETERHPVEGRSGQFELRDMDGDGDGDAVLFSHDSGPSFHLLRNDGSGRFGLETVSGIGTFVESLTVEDLDGDGDADVAAAGRASTPTSCQCAIAQVDVFRNRGDATFDQPRSFLTLSFALVAHAAPLGPGPPGLLLMDHETVTIVGNLTEPALSQDRDRDGVPDECQARGMFHRGDPSGDGTANLTDAIVILLHLFLGAPGPGCLDAADANDDGALDITDPIAVLEWLFLGGPQPPPPGPPGDACGPDPPGSTLGCEAFPDCG